MATYQRGKYWWYRFRFAGERIDEPTKSTSRTVAKEAVGESADAVWRDLGHEREKVLPHPAAVEPESEMVIDLAPDLPGLIAAEPAPTPFGIHLIEPNLPSKKRKKAALWPTAAETNVQLSLFD